MTAFRHVSSRPYLVLAALGSLLVFAYPPFSIGFIAWVAYAVFLRLLDDRSLSDHFRLGWWFGFTHHLALLYWIGWVSIPGMLVVVAILGVYIAVTTWVFGLFKRRFGAVALWLWPLIWVSHEYLRGLGDLAFPWSNLSYTQLGYLELIQFASITGDLGVSLYVCFLNVLVYWLLRGTISPVARIAMIGAMIVLVVVPLIYGKGEIDRLTNQRNETVTVAALQGDIDSRLKWDSAYVDFSFATYGALSHLAAADSVDLIIWPETAVPRYLRASTARLREIQQLSRDVETPLLVGTLDYEVQGSGEYLYYNAARQIKAGRLSQTYHAKLQLVPMGEWVPFSDKIPFLQNLHLGQADFSAGTEYNLFEHEKGDYAVLVCFESAFPGIVRRFVSLGAAYLVNITNDGWYGFSPGPYQHAGMCVMRAIENRRIIARSANSGVSLFVDCTGHILNPSDMFFTDVRTATLPLCTEMTFFTRHGRWLAWWCFMVTGVLCVFVAGESLVRRR